MRFLISKYKLNISKISQIVGEEPNAVRDALILQEIPKGWCEKIRSYFQTN